MSVSHPNASELFSRDVNCLVKFFAMKMHFVPDSDAVPSFSSITPSDLRLDQQVGNRIQSDVIDEQDDLGLLDQYYRLDSLQIEGDQEVEGELSEEEVESVFHRIGNTEDNEQLHEDMEKTLERDEGESSSDLSDVLEGEGGNHLGKGLMVESQEEFARRKLEGIKTKLRRQSDRGKTPGGSRNSTKKINKYGRIVKNEKIDQYS